MRIISKKVNNSKAAKIRVAEARLRIAKRELKALLKESDNGYTDRFESEYETKGEQTYRESSKKK